MSTKINDFAATARLWRTIGPVAAASGDVTSDAVDLIEGDGPAFAILSLGPDAGSAGVTGRMQASDDSTTWDDIPNTAFNETGPGVQAVTFQRPKRYVRAALTVHDAADPITFTLLLGQSRKLL
jgi:hypothetical protein